MGDAAPYRLTEEEVEERLARLDGLLGRVEDTPGGDGDIARAAVAGLVEVYGEALARAVEAGATTPDAVRRLSADPLLGHLMALHGLHPDSPEHRVEQAVSDIQARLHGGGSVELQGIEDGVAQLTVTASGCGSDGLASSVRDIVLAAAPELADVRAAPAASTEAFIPLGALHRR